MSTVARPRPIQTTVTSVPSVSSAKPSPEPYEMQRHTEGVILSPQDFPGADAVFNCGQIMMGEQTILLVSVSHRCGQYRGVLGATTHVARSDNGIDFEIDPNPLLQRASHGLYALVDHHPIDTRVTKIDDWYYIVHPACTAEWGTFGLLGRTRDFNDYEEMDVISLPDNRVPCLFPEKINGQYWRLDRPYRVAPNEHHTLGNIWAASGPDLLHWGGFRPMLRPGFAPWAQTKIGPTPPIRTDEGWLVVIHGVAGSCGGYRYGLGLVLLELDNPLAIRGVTRHPILMPDMLYERTGAVPNVVFACGAIADAEQDTLRMYYGCADTCIGLATGSLSGAVQACLDDGPIENS